MPVPLFSRPNNTQEDSWQGQSAPPSAQPDSPQSLQARAVAIEFFAPRDWLFAAALVIAVFLAYHPVWEGGFIWDDDGHVTPPGLRSWYGLYRIWFDLGATQQYYPLLHSAFWVQHKLWGDATLGYHLVNILLHAVAALMVALILRWLKVPGAYLAAAIFALHPVHVESVAWITELKNTLSAVFYLGAAMVYLHFDQTRRPSLYLTALGLFVLGLLSKTVTATLPAALLVVFWWQRGRLSWKQDVLPLIPFFVLGAIAGLSTAWVERILIGAEGAAFELGAVERFLLAGRAIWFYLGKLVWPRELIFIYPRWRLDPAEWWQYGYLVAALLVLGVFWRLRRRWRGPLAALLYFVGTLFPVLGFFNVYPFLFSYVADHFQYLASLGVIVLVSAGMALLLARWPLWGRVVGYGLCVALLATLGTLTWWQSRMYADVEALYRTTIDRNPDCWMAHNNLGLALAERGQVEQAVVHFKRALEIERDYPDAHNNLGLALADRGQLDEAIYHFREALKADPNYFSAHNNLGNALVDRGQLREAITHYQRALEIRPDYAQAHNNLGLALADSGQVEEAMAHFRKAVELQPNYIKAHSNLGRILARRGQVDEAAAHYRKVLEIEPSHADAHNNLGSILARLGQVDKAIIHFRKAVLAAPKHADAYNNLGVALAGRKQLDEAIVQFQKALAIRPQFVEARQNLDRALIERTNRDGHK